MPFFTIHVERAFDIEANTVEEAMELYDLSVGQPEGGPHYIDSRLADLYVTDEDGDEVA